MNFFFVDCNQIKFCLAFVGPYPSTIMVVGYVCLNLLFCLSKGLDAFVFLRFSSFIVDKEGRCVSCFFPALAQ